MFNLDNLPGVISQVNDYNLGNIQESDANKTESVLILGTAIDGPKGLALPIRSISDAIALYGDFKDAAGNPNGATLVRGIIEAYKSGCRDIRAMRITGKLANRPKVDDLGNANDSVITASDLYDLSLEAKFEGNVYNSVYVTFDHVAGVMNVYKPASKLTDGERKATTIASGSTIIAVPFKYSDFNLTQSSSLADFVRAVNRHPSNNVVQFKIVDTLGNDLTNSLNPGARALAIKDIKSLDGSSNPIKYTLTGGADETSIDAVELYKRLGGYVTSYTLGADSQVSVMAMDSTTIAGYENAVYDLLVNYKVDNVVLMDGYADQDLGLFKNVDGSAKVAVSEDEFMTIVPTSRPYIDLKLTADVKDASNVVLYKSGSTVAKLYAKIPATMAATSTIEIKAASATPSIAMTGTTSKTIVITPAIGAATIKDIYTQIQTSTDSLGTKSGGGTIYPKDILSLSLLIPVQYYTSAFTITATTTTFKPVSVYSTQDNFARQLAQACAVISSKNNECIGVIGCTSAPATDLVTLRNYINGLLGRKDSKTPAIHVSTQFDLYLKSADGGKIFNDGNKPIDIGGYINIVAAPELVFADGVLGAYAATGASAYAGLISTLPAENSTTNRKIDGAVVLRYELSGQQLNDLTGAGYVTFRNNYDNGIVVTDGITAAGLMSDFQRLTTKRITNAAMHVVRRVCEPFIGLPNSLAQRNALTTAIQAGLDGMKQAGAIQDASFEVFSSKKDQVLGNALIDLTIVPVFEFRKIRVYVNLKAPV